MSKEEIKPVIGTPSVTTSEDKTSAVIAFPKEEFTNFIGKELAEAQEKIMSAANTYLGQVVEVGYSTAGRLFAEEDTMQNVDIEAPIFAEGDSIQAHITREEVDLVGNEDYVPAIKINQHVASSENVRTGIKTMGSVYNEIIASKNK